MAESDHSRNEAERRLAEQRSRDRDELLSVLTEHAKDFIRIHDLDGRSVYASPSVLRLYGREPATLFEMAHPDDVEPGRRWWLKVVEGGTERLHWRIRDAAGDWRWLETSPAIVQYRGRPHILTVCRDITDRMRVEEALRAAEARLHHVVGSSPAVLFTMKVEDGQFRGINWISANVETILGYRAEDTLGADWWLANIHPEDRDTVANRFLASIPRDDRFTAEYRFRHADGRHLWIRGETQMLRDAAGQPMEVVGSLSDVTERKRLEEQFHQAQKMEAVGHLAGGVAHDFNNLLTIISGYSEILLPELPFSDPRREMVAQIREAGERAAGLTRQLLAFSRQMVLDPKVLDLNEVVRENERMLRRLIGEDVRLAAVLDPALDPVKVDPGQIGQVIMNLAVNARDAMPTGGTLTIQTNNVTLDAAASALDREAEPGDYVRLSVTDTGTGMTPDIQAHIFEPFFTTKGPGKGTGLGLATVYGIVKQSGGFSAVDSEPGRGTAFSIYLPVTWDHDSAERPSLSPKAIAQGTETILLVEDEDAVRSIVGVVLRQAGYRVLEANSGTKALRVAEENPGPIHLLVTDVVMPEMGGRQLVERLTALRPGIKVLYLSGYTDDAVIRHGVLHADVAFLQKPFTMSALSNKVRQVLDDVIHRDT